MDIRACGPPFVPVVGVAPNVVIQFEQGREVRNSKKQEVWNMIQVIEFATNSCWCWKQGTPLACKDRGRIDHFRLMCLLLSTCKSWITDMLSIATSAPPFHGTSTILVQFKQFVTPHSTF